MNIRMLATVFFSVFLSELGDKTQLATLLFASQKEMSKTGVFVAASSALVLTTLIGVLVGAQVGRFVPPNVLKVIAGVGFIVIGAWVLIGARGHLP